MGLAGYVKNLPDGSVEIFAQGDEKILNEFLKKINNPPYPAIVKEIKREEVKPNPEYKYFKIIFGEIGEELQEGFGAMQTIFMDYWREFGNYREEFRGYRKEIQRL